MSAHAALQDDRHSGFGVFFLANTSKKPAAAVQGFDVCTFFFFFHFCQVIISPSLYLCAAKSHMKVVLPQQGYLW